MMRQQCLGNRDDNRHAFISLIFAALALGTQAQAEDDLQRLIADIESDSNQIISSSPGIEGAFTQEQTDFIGVENTAFTPVNGPESCTCDSGIQNPPQCTDPASVDEISTIRENAKLAKAAAQEVVLQTLAPMTTDTIADARSDLVLGQQAATGADLVIVTLLSRGVINAADAQRYQDRLQGLEDQLSQAEDLLNLAQTYLRRSVRKTQKAIESADAALAALQGCPSLPLARLKMAEAERRLLSAGRNGASAAGYGDSAQELLDDTSRDILKLTLELAARAK